MPNMQRMQKSDQEYRNWLNFFFFFDLNIKISEQIQVAQMEQKESRPAADTSA